MAWEHSRNTLIVGRCDGSLVMVHVVVSSRGMIIEKKEIDSCRRERSKSKCFNQDLSVVASLVSLVAVSSISCSCKQPMLAVGFEDGVVCVLVSDDDDSTDGDRGNLIPHVVRRGHLDDRNSSVQYVIRCQYQTNQVHVC
jgi:hypothetical protein